MNNFENNCKPNEKVDPGWLLDQWARPDGEERMAAFYKSIRDAVLTDEECWENKGRDSGFALEENNAEAILIALYG
jgi:hypothetical protein